VALPVEPLPVPAAAPDVAPLDIMLAVAANASNSTNPDVVVGAAQSAGSADDAATNAQATVGYAQAAKAAANLSAQNGVNQDQAWGQMAPGEQDQLKAAGYTPPNHQGGIWDDIQRVGSDVLHNRVVGDITNALGAPLRSVQHGMRTALDVGAGSSGLSALSPDDWARAWDETTNGTSYIDPGFKKQALVQYGRQTYELALKQATGQSTQQILAATPTAQQQQVATALSSPEVQAATNYLNAGHLSEGRVVADLVLGQGRGDYRAKSVTESSPAYKWLSGTIDAATDWWGDPTVVGAKVAGSVKGLRYVVSDGQDVLNLFDRSASVRAKMGQLASGVRDVQESGGTQGIGRLLEMGKDLGNTGTIEKLVQAGADTAEKVRDWFADTQNLMAFAQGTGAHADDPVYIPHLSLAGQASMKAKGVLTKALNFGDAGPVSVKVDPDAVAAGPLVPQGLDRITVGGGRLVSRAYRLMPTSHIFNPSAPDALNNFRDILSMFMKPADADQFLSAFATNPDIGARWQVYRSAMQTLGRMAGLEPGTDEWDSVMGPYTSGYGRVYGAGNVDKMFVNGQAAHVGYLKAHMNDGWLVPSFKELYTGSKKLGLTQKLTRGVNANFLDRFMGVWRPLTLARLGFATRVGGEEAAGFMLREGPLNYLRAQGARLAERGMLRQQGVANAVADQTGLDEPVADQTMRDIVATDHGRTFNMLSSGLTPTEVATSRNIGQLFARRLARGVHGAMEKTGMALTSDHYQMRIQQLIDHGDAEEGGNLNQALTAAHYDTPDTVSDLDSTVKIKDKASGKLYNGELRGTGDYKAYQPGDTDNLYRMVYQRSLHQVASDDWGRDALVHWQPRADRVQTIADKLMDDPTWKMARRSQVDRAENYVAHGDIDLRQAAEDHANVIVDGAEALIRSARDNSLLQIEKADGSEEPLANYLLREGKAPPWFASRELAQAGQPEQLAHIPLEDLPRDVAGPELVPGFGRYNVRRMTNAMFRNVVTPQINWLSRTPMRLHNYALARDVFEPFADHLRAQGMDDEQVEDLIHEHSVNRAMHTTLPYIHNPELRSQMSQVTRNLAPFWFAQEQFYKRWARTFFYSPWAYRQASLVSNGLSHMGFIHTDPEDNQEYFVYPGSALVTDVISHTLGAFGVNDQIPVAADLTGQVSMLNPGLNRGFLPNYGPTVVIPLDGLKMLDPHMTNAINSIEGSDASSSNFLSSVVPGTVLHLADVIDPTAINASQYASAQMSAIQYLEATGHGLGQTATNLVGTLQPGQSPPKTAGPYKAGDYFTQGLTNYVLQPDGKWRDNGSQAMKQYLDRVNNWARILMVTRAIYGFSGPAAPEDYFNPSGLSTQLTTFMNEMPYTQAVSTFMALHPNATAMTVFQTANNVDGFLPATQAAMQWLGANKKLVDEHPLASTYLLPAPDTAGQFDLAAYQEQLAEGLRTQKTPADYWTEIAYQSAANIYYGVQGYKDQLIASHQMPTAQVDQFWTAFSTKFMGANPLFATMFGENSGFAAAAKRMEIMGQIGDALRDGSAPPGPQTTAIQQLYNAWGAWQAATTDYGQPNAPSSSQADQINQQFAVAVGAFVQKNPSVLPLVQRVIQPELASTLTDMAATGVTVNGL
jgi:hypothetical protein